MDDYRYLDGQTIKEVFSELFQYYKCEDHIYEARVIGSWQSLMGKMIHKHTLSIKVRQGVLTVWLDSSVLREELFFAKDKIKAMANSVIKENAIKDVVFK